MFVVKRTIPTTLTTRGQAREYMYTTTHCRMELNIVIPFWIYNATHSPIYIWLPPRLHKRVTHYRKCRKRTSYWESCFLVILTIT